MKLTPEGPCHGGDLTQLAIGFKGGFVNHAGESITDGVDARASLNPRAMAPEAIDSDAIESRAIASQAVDPHVVESAAEAAGQLTPLRRFGGKHHAETPGALDPRCTNTLSQSLPAVSHRLRNLLMVLQNVRFSVSKSLAEIDSLEAPIASSVELALDSVTHASALLSALEATINDGSDQSESYFATAHLVFEKDLAAAGVQFRDVPSHEHDGAIPLMRCFYLDVLYALTEFVGTATTVDLTVECDTRGSFLLRITGTAVEAGVVAAIPVCFRQLAECWNMSPEWSSEERGWTLDLNLSEV